MLNNIYFLEQCKLSIILYYPGFIHICTSMYPHHIEVRGGGGGGGYKFCILSSFSYLCIRSELQEQS